MKTVLSYAQNREDLYIASFFPDVEKGFYVDIGAHDPTLESVTKFFYERGWSGINVEPQRKQIKLFNQRRKRDINLCLGVADKKGKLKLREYPGGGLSTFSDALKDEYDHEDRMKEVSFVEHEVEVTTLKSLLSEHAKNRAIQFMKIDVEGLEFEVIQGNDWLRFRPELLCIEANHIVKDWHGLLEHAGYHQVFFDGLNEYYLAKESLYRKELFNFPAQFLAGRGVGDSILTYPTHKRMEGLRMEKEKLARRLEASEKSYQSTINQLQRQISSNDYSLEYHFRSLPRAFKHGVGQTLRKLKLRGNG